MVRPFRRHRQGTPRGGDLAYTDIEKWWVLDTDTDALTDSTVVFPCSRVWPMGYSWSSAVAQDVSLGLLRVAGFDEEQVLSVEHPPPVDQAELMCVLTDDCIMAHVLTCPSDTAPMCFSRSSAAGRVRLLDSAMALTRSPTQA